MRYNSVEEYRENILEYIGGELVSICYHNPTSALGFLLMNHMREGEESCPYLFTGAGGGYMVCGERYVPNFACISIARHREILTQKMLTAPTYLILQSKLFALVTRNDLAVQQFRNIQE